MPEIDEATWQAHQQVMRFAQTALADPTKRKTLLAWDEQFNPDKKHPELHAPDPTSEALTAIQADLAKLREETAAEKAARAEAEAQAKLRREWDAGRQIAREAGFTTEGIRAVEELMEKRGIADWEAGLALYNKLNPPAEVVANGSSNWDLFGPETQESPDMKGLIEDIANGGDGTAFLHQAVPAAIKAVRSGNAG
jgi:hypothetical protein